MSSSKSTSGLMPVRRSRISRTARWPRYRSWRSASPWLVARGESDGKTLARPFRMSSSSASRRSRSKPWRYSSSASTNSPNGRSRSSSEADPESTRWPRASRRGPRSSVEKSRLSDAWLADDLNGHRSAPGVERGKEVIEQAELFGSSYEVLGNGHCAFPHEHRSGTGKPEIRVSTPMSWRAFASQSRYMPCYVLHHRHEPHECGIVFASFRGHESVLRRKATLASCRSGEHAIWWTVSRAV